MSEQMNEKMCFNIIPLKSRPPVIFSFENSAKWRGAAKFLSTSQASYERSEGEGYQGISIKVGVRKPSNNKICVKFSSLEESFSRWHFNVLFGGFNLCESFDNYTLRRILAKEFSSYFCGHDALRCCTTTAAALIDVQEFPSCKILWRS